jgi:hypothetical protein
VIGKHSGSQALAHVLDAAGVSVSRDQARDMLPIFRELAIALGGTVPTSVAALIARQLVTKDLPPKTDAKQDMS